MGSFDTFTHSGREAQSKVFGQGFASYAVGDKLPKPRQVAMTAEEYALERAGHASPTFSSDVPDYQAAAIEGDLSGPLLDCWIQVRGHKFAGLTTEHEPAVPAVSRHGRPSTRGRASVNL